ncbi:MAG: metallophosphoesterase [Candidatus Sericytochromatia bacterium]|nr:metallophosphoesterase [Candidatus Sericytochromatia bacterium]
MRAMAPLFVSLFILGACRAPGVGAAATFGSARRDGFQAAQRQDAALLVGAGDIAYEGPGAEQTARLLDRLPGTIFLLGDNAYQSGSPEEFARYFHPTWGRHFNRIRPVVGNHEYRTPGAAGYFGYFGERAGDPRKGYYSYDVSPAWHVVVINSATTGDAASKELGPESAQYRWVAQDLEAHQGQNVIAMWHHPRFSSGAHGDNKETDALWRLLASKGVDLALWGHDHHYERFEPMDAEGKRDAARGVRSFVVGTGGKNHYMFFKLPKSTTAVRNASTFGVLQLALYPDGYEWEFVPVEGETFTDRGQSSVH